jgi:hypothetical protein
VCLIKLTYGISIYYINTQSIKILCYLYIISLNDDSDRNEESSVVQLW